MKKFEDGSVVTVGNWEEGRAKNGAWEFSSYYSLEGTKCLFYYCLEEGTTVLSTSTRRLYFFPFPFFPNRSSLTVISAYG